MKNFLIAILLTFSFNISYIYSYISYDKLNGSFTVINNNNNVVNGKCGASNGLLTNSVPELDLCISGNPTEITGTGPWSWTCEGKNGGETVSCSTKKENNSEGGNSKIPHYPDIFIEENEPEEPEKPEISEEEKEPEISEEEKEPEIPELNSPDEKQPKKENKIEKPNDYEEFVDYSKIKGGNFIKKYPKILIKTGTPVNDRIKTIYSESVETKTKKSDFRLAGNNNSNINFWKQVLPDIDKDASKYIVIPSNGLVMPIVSLKSGTQDYENAINGREFNYRNIMKNGVLEYPGINKNSYGEVGNNVLFGHSSYWKNSTGRYKTQFQKIIGLDINEEVWIYEKDKNGNYIRYIYIVKSSYLTTPNDTNIMKPGYGRNITLVTCTPIGGISGRWVVKAEMKGDIKQRIFSQKYGKVIDKYILSLEKKNLSKKEFKDFYIKTYNYLSEKEKGGKNDKILDIIKYFKFRIYKEYKKFE